MEAKKKGTKLLYCALGALVPAYWLHHRRASKSQSDNNQIIDDLEIVKKLKMNSALCHIPLIILSIYDGYIYENKILRKIYGRLRDRSSQKAPAPSASSSPSSAGNSSRTEEGTHAPNYHFIMHSEKSIFNKMYFYEIILDKSLRYAVISPQLSLYILRQLSQHVVNLNTRLYHEKEFSLHREKRGGGRDNGSDIGRDNDRGRWLANWVMRLAWGGGAWTDEMSNSYYSDNGNDGEEGEERSSPPRKKHLPGKAKGNLYEKYAIHKYEQTFNQTTEGGISPSPQHDQVSINLLYLLNKAYDNVNRICTDTDTNIFVNFYMINILKFICYKNYRHVLMNSSFFEDLDRRNRKGRSFVDYFCAFFFSGGGAPEEGYLARDDADRHLFCGEAEGEGERGHSESAPTGGLTSGSTSTSTSGLTSAPKSSSPSGFPRGEGPTARKATSSSGEQKQKELCAGEAPTGRSARTPSNSPSPKGVQKGNDKEDVVQKNTHRNRNHHVVAHGKADQRVAHGKADQIVSHGKATSQTAVSFHSHGGNPHQQEDTQERHPHNCPQYQNGMDEKMKILNDLYLVLYLRLLLECCIKIVSIKKNLLVLEEKVKFEKGNKIFYLSTSDAIENLKVHFLKRFRRGEEKRGLHIFFRPYGNAGRNGPPGKRQDIPTDTSIKKIPIWHSTDAQPTNEEQYSLATWKSKLKGHSKRAKVYMDRKLFKLKKIINYYVINLDEAIKNKYYKRVHEKNVKRINEHLRENAQKEIDLGRFHDIYSNMVANLNGILSFAYAVDARNEAHRILALYNTCVFYQYNYFNEYDSLFFKNGRIQKCLNIFSYIYNKNHFSKYCSLCCVFHKLNFIVLSRRSSSHW
ncbi:hypothetical protein PCYB_083590, partial [Plasmodium cynomolgi strain B]